MKKRKWTRQDTGRPQRQPPTVVCLYFSAKKSKDKGSSDRGSTTTNFSLTKSTNFAKQIYENGQARENITFSNAGTSMKRTIANFISTLELIEDVLKVKPVPPICLIICATRAEFLRQLIPSLLEPVPSLPIEIPSSQDEPVDLETHEEEQQHPHPLLTPTLNVLAATKPVRLVFCPSITTLRAYLASHTCQEAALTILNLIRLHHSTSEFSAQGLSRTLAGAVSAAARSNATHLRLAECSDLQDPSNPHSGARIWAAQVPLLSGSVRIGGEGAGWAGRSISARSIAGRWFRFEKQSQPEIGRGIETEPDDAEQ